MANLLQQENTHATVTMSTALFLNWQWNALSAIDGSLNLAADSCQCCAATETQGSRWLQLDLGKLYLLQIIQILGRSGKSGRSMFIGKQTYLENTSITI